jgi:hypothetical protein
VTPVVEHDIFLLWYSNTNKLCFNLIKKRKIITWCSKFDPLLNVLVNHFMCYFPLNQLVAGHILLQFRMNKSHVSCSLQKQGWSINLRKIFKMIINVKAHEYHSETHWDISHLHLSIYNVVILHMDSLVEITGLAYYQNPMCEEWAICSFFMYGFEFVSDMWTHCQKRASKEYFVFVSFQIALNNRTRNRFLSHCIEIILSTNCIMRTGSDGVNTHFSKIKFM